MAGFGLRLPDPIGLFTDSVLGDANPGAPALTIEELTGARRTIELRGRALPYRPVGWGGHMRTKNTWYQGNPVATQQVLGPELPDTVLEGQWKDRFMFGAEAAGEVSAVLVNGSPTEVRSAEAAVSLFYELLNSGNTLQVIWGPEVRVGILVDFVPKYQRLQDIEWRAEFEWSSRGEIEARAVETPVGSDDLLGSINGLDDILGFSPEDVVRAFNAQLLDTVESVRESTGIIFEALRTVEAVASIPQSVLGAIQSAAESVRLELTEEIGRLTENSASGGQGASATVRAAALFSVEACRRTTARRAAAVRRDALEIDRQTQERATPVQVQIIPVPEDTSLYTLSNRFYGTPDFASFLARANGLTSAIAPAGFQLRVPPRPPTSAAAAQRC
jgi:hypothetical protein